MHEDTILKQVYCGGNRAPHTQLVNSLESCRLLWPFIPMLCVRGGGGLGGLGSITELLLLRLKLMLKAGQSC